jgi:hypothetical protein
MQLSDPDPVPDPDPGFAAQNVPYFQLARLI